MDGNALRRDPFPEIFLEKTKNNRDFGESFVTDGSHSSWYRRFLSHRREPNAPCVYTKGEADGRRVLLTHASPEAFQSLAADKRLERQGYAIHIVMKVTRENADSFPFDFIGRRRGG